MTDGRRIKLSNFNRHVAEEVQEIMQRFAWCMWGTRVFLLLQRKKEGGNTREDRRRHMSFVATSEREYAEVLTQMVSFLRVSDEPLRIYVSAAPRDMRKAELELKRKMLDADFSGNESKETFYLYFYERWVSALMSANPLKDENVFILDVDDAVGDPMAPVLKKIAYLGISEIARYRTKSGWHIAVKPFNRTLWDVPNVEVKVDALALLAY